MKTMTKTTTTNEQIRRVREAALAKGDYQVVDLCDRAVTDDVVDQNGDPIAFAGWTREEAISAILDDERQ